MALSTDQHLRSTIVAEDSAPSNNPAAKVAWNVVSRPIIKAKRIKKEPVRIIVRNSGCSSLHDLSCCSFRFRTKLHRFRKMSSIRGGLVHGRGLQGLALLRRPPMKRTPMKSGLEPIVSKHWQMSMRWRKNWEQTRPRKENWSVIDYESRVGH